jgi:two-component system, NtrC family, sensor histidine kinase PilS
MKAYFLVENIIAVLSIAAGNRISNQLMSLGKLFPLKIDVAQTASNHASWELWRSLHVLNFYRLILGILLFSLVWVFGSELVLGQRDLSLFYQVSLVYITLSLLNFPLVRLQRPSFNIQLGLQVGTDIVCIVLLSYASGGTASNLGILLLVTLAAAGLICRGRITLFFAALASIAVLLEHSYSILTQDASGAQYMHASLLSIAYFAVAWAAHRLSKYATATEKLAALREVDVSYLAEANRMVIQDMPAGVLLVDERGVIRQANPGAARLLGYVFSGDRKEMLSDCSPLLGALYGVWRQSRTNRDEVLNLPLTHNEVKVRFLPVQREGFGGAVVVLEDMQRAQAQAQQVKLAALGRLTANIAHEVRNPLSSISYAAELLQEGEQLEGQARLFNIILDNAFRLNSIVLDVLQVNRRDRVQKVEFDLAKQLPYFLENLQNTENFTPGIIEIEVAQGCVVNFDRGHFDQILWNLCRNALRYCQRQQGSVKINVSCSEDGHKELEICNDGGTIPIELVQRLFEPFFTTSVGGTGLGLYIARELCEANGSRLEYKPTPEGAACFRISFGVQDEL